MYNLFGSEFMDFLVYDSIKNQEDYINKNNYSSIEEDNKEFEYDMFSCDLNEE